MKQIYNLNQQLDDLMNQYGLVHTGEEHFDIVLRKIQDILEKACKNKVVAIRGCGVHTQELLKIMKFPCRIAAFYNSASVNEGKYEWEGKSYPILPSKQLTNTSADAVIISSFRHRKTIKEELENLCPKIPVIDIYAELYKEGINLQEAFYYNTQQGYHNVLLWLSKYRAASNEQDTEQCLQNLIFYSLKIRDFVNTFSYLECYINKGYQYSKPYSEFRDALKDFLKWIWKELQDRKERDIIIFWNDQVGYEDLEKFPCIAQAAENGISFSNAFTPVPFTYASFWGMFEKQYSMDDNIYFIEHNKIGEQNSILHMLNEKGYTFRYIGDGPTGVWFQDKFQKGYPSYDSSCVRCFDMLEELMNSDTKMCIMLHALVETHNPYMSGELEDAKWFEWPYIDVDIKKVKDQINSSAAYWSKQLDFYLKFIKPGSSKVFMSDHGKRYFAEPIYNDLANHILFVIQDDRLESRQENKLFTINNLEEVLEYLSDSILSDEKYERIFSHIIKMQEVGIFNDSALRYYMAEKQYDSFMPYRAARGERDKYVKLSNGKEFYFRLPDEEKNEIDNPIYQQRIQELKTVAGRDFTNRDKFEAELKRFRKAYETH